MNLQDIEYPLRLCVEMMNYCAWSNYKTKDITPSQLYEKLGELFTEEQIQESRKILCGELSLSAGSRAEVRGRF